MVGYVSKDVIHVTKDDSRFVYWYNKYKALIDKIAVPVALTFAIQDSFINDEKLLNITPDKMIVKELGTCYHITILKTGLVS